MRLMSLACLMAVILAARAEAQEIGPILPGVMCQSAEALGQLTKNDGSSKSDDKATAPEVLAVKARGGCMTARRGNLVERHKNRSVITSDP